MAELTAFDVVVLLMIAVGGLAGLARGFVTEVLSLLAWVGAFFAVRLLYPLGKPLAADLTGTDAGGAILAFVVIFIIAYILFNGVAQSLGGRTRDSIVGPVDRVLGLGFGAFKGLLVGAVLYLVATLVLDITDPGEPRPEWLATARTAPILALTSRAMVDFVEERRNEGRRAADRPEEPGLLDRLLDRPGGTAI